MKYILFSTVNLLCICISNKLSCDKLPNGQYIFRCTQGTKITYESRLLIADSNYIEYYKDGDSSSGKIRWLNNCNFRMELNKNKGDTLNALVELINKSFGESYISLNAVKKDTIEFTQPHPDPHVFGSSGYFLRLPNGK